MAKSSREVSGYTPLPIQLQSSVTSLRNITHYIYLKPHDPPVAYEDATRSLFLVNIPAHTTAIHLKHLFATQLEAGRIERIDFVESGSGSKSTTLASVASNTKSSRKRKRMNAEELEAGLETYSLPKVFEREVHETGATAIAVFVDRSSMELSLKAAKKAAKYGTEIVWGDGIEQQLSPLGLRRYERHNGLQYPSRRELLRCVDGYMAIHAQVEEAKSKENARKRQLPDEEGFVTVTRGAKGSLRHNEAKELGEKQKTKTKDAGVEDFYRFQMREKRREQQNELLKKFEDDKKKIAEMRQRRGKVIPE